MTNGLSDKSTLVSKSNVTADRASLFVATQSASTRARSPIQISRELATGLRNDEDIATQQHGKRVAQHAGLHRTATFKHRRKFDRLNDLTPGYDLKSGLAALGIANMWIAIISDVGVMILAVLNAIRCLFVKNL